MAAVSGPAVMRRQVAIMQVALWGMPVASMREARRPVASVLVVSPVASVREARQPVANVLVVSPVASVREARRPVANVLVVSPVAHEQVALPAAHALVPSVVDSVTVA